MIRNIYLKNQRKVNFILLLGSLILVSGCAPKISNKISKQYPALDYREEVRVFNLDESLPPDAEELGKVNINDNGFSANCGWSEVIELAKTEARKIGGNAIKITKHRPPDFTSSCHRIDALIVRIENLDQQKITEVLDTSLISADYALLRIYRNNSYGTLIRYDLYLGDSLIARVANNWRKTVKVKKDGYNTLWAKTEAKEELPIKIEKGKEYYIRCGVRPGLMIGRPELELVDNQRGKSEFGLIKAKNEITQILMNDGSIIECYINYEDNDNLYITDINDKQNQEKFIRKSEIKKIDKKN